MSKSRTSRERPSPEAGRRFPWSVPVAIGDVPDSGRHIDLSAEAQIRAAIARLAGVTAVRQLTASLDLSLRGRDGLRVVGRVVATVEQVCGVTLEPMESEVDEPVDLVFLSEDGAGPADRLGDRRGEEIEVTAEDAPEVLEGGVVDLGAIATESLLLGIDPYPRKPGAVLAAVDVDTDDRTGPFAALAALRKGDD
ncbi:MAG: DUF177 domain-containing protein [Hyphomicrobiales bacterium]|nr:DUF177 domain-containing protein [Hyphomicrobiales bacterium]